MKQLYKVTPSKKDCRFHEEVSCLAENKDEAIELARIYFDHYQFPLEAEEVNMNETQIVTVCQEKKKVEWYNSGFFKTVDEMGNCCRN